MPEDYVPLGPRGGKAREDQEKHTDDSICMAW